VATSAKDSTTSTVVVHGDRAVLIDPAWLPDELERLAGELSHRGWIVTAGLSTHAHHDHLLWHPGFGSAPRWASAVTCELIAEHRSELVAALGSFWPAELLPSFGDVNPLTSDAIPDPFGPDGPVESIEVSVHNGHAPGHSAVWLPERGVLVAGDMLSDTELPLPFGPDDLPSYFEALDLLAPYVSRARVLVPGHGSPTEDPQARLDADRRYLDDVLSGQPASDSRIGNPGMAANHEHLVDLARRLREDTMG